MMQLYEQGAKQGRWDFEYFRDGVKLSLFSKLLKPKILTFTEIKMGLTETITNFFGGTNLVEKTSTSARCCEIPTRYCWNVELGPGEVP